MEKCKKSKSLLEVVLILGILLFFSLIVITNIFHFNYMMNADLASDVILSKLIWTSKEIIPSTWYIAAETRIICTPNLAALFYGLTQNMTLSTGLACSFMAILVVVGMFYLGRKAGLNWQESCMFTFLGLALFTNYIILELVYLFASYYAIHVVILFFTLGLYAESIKSKRVRPVGVIISLLFALCLGMQGTRGILVLYGPLFGIEAIRNIYYIYCKRNNNKPDWIISAWVCMMLVISFLGTSFPLSVEQNISRNIRMGIHKLFTIVIPDMYSTLGFSHTNGFGKICLTILLLIVLYILADIVCRMCKKKEIEAVEWAFLVVCSSPIVSAVMVAFTTVESSDRYYFLLFYAMAFAATLTWRKISDKWCAMKISGGILIVAFTFMNIHNIYLPILKCEEPPCSDLNAVGEYLADNNYLTAYSSFDNANTITVLTNGKVRVAAVASLEKMDICEWMSSTLWYVPNVPFEEKTAYVIPEPKIDEFNKFLERHGEEVKFDIQIGSYLIYVSDYNFSKLE